MIPELQAQARATYEAGRLARGEEARALTRRADAIGTARLLAALGALVGVGVAVWGSWPHATTIGTALAIASVLTFIALVMVHARVHSRRDGATAAERFHQRGLARLEATWAAFPEAGARFESDDHPFSSDLDLFGPASVFQRISTAELRGGQDRLAAWLLGDPADAATLIARQDAVRELSAKTDLREALSAAGALLAETSGKGADVSSFSKWASEGASASTSSAVTWIARVIPLLTICAFVLSRLDRAPPAVWVALLVVGIVFGISQRARVEPLVSIAGAREESLARYGALFARLETETFTSASLKALQARFSRSGSRATTEMARLARIVGFVDARQNEVFRLFIAPVLLWDLNLASFLDAWRVRTGPSVAAWFDALFEIEALASLAGLAFEEPGFTFPTFEQKATYQAKKLGHPLVRRDTRVDNDVALPGPGQTLVVTGSNMAGKTTLLRALGVNAVLAFAGGPVCAEHLSIGLLRVSTSMRIRDSLGEGVSRFYAELRRLKLVMERAAEGPSLFLLDEILHGTNTRERLIGARGLVLALLDLQAIGAVSTHDLALGDLETERAGQVQNVHFEEQVDGEKMTFDYRLRSGVVQSSNALRLMKAVGLDVPGIG